VVRTGAIGCAGLLGGEQQNSYLTWQQAQRTPQLSRG